MNKTERIQELLRLEPTRRSADIASEIECSTRLVRKVRQDMRVDTGAPNILLFDVESAPMEVYVWQLSKNDWIHPQNVIKEWSILSWSAKWLFDSEIMGGVVSTEEAENRSDASIINSIWDLMDEADMVIAHNAAAFDVRKLNLRFLANELPPPKPYQVVDTLKVSRRYFAASSHKLDYLAELLNISGKGEHNWDMWKRAVTGDEQALADMLEYNQQDVLALEELYVKLRPWIKSHPNMGLYMDTDKTVCPNCGSASLDWNGHYYTAAGKFRAFRCECGAIGRSRHSAISKEKKDALVVPVAR